jgi:hypothetical protein
MKLQSIHDLESPAYRRLVCAMLPRPPRRSGRWRIVAADGLSRSGSPESAVLFVVVWVYPGTLHRTSTTCSRFEKKNNCLVFVSSFATPRQGKRNIYVARVAVLEKSVSL